MSIDEFNSLKVGTKIISIHSDKVYKIKSKRNKDKWCTNGDFFISNYNRHEYELVK